MKKLFSSILSVTLLTAGAQTEEARWNLGLHGGFTQYSGDLGQGWYRTDQAAYSFVGFSVSRYLSRHFDVGILGTRGEAGYVAPRDYTMDPDVKFNFLVSLSTVNLFLRYNFTGRESFIRPYLFGGPSMIRQPRLHYAEEGGERGWEFLLPSAGAGIAFRFGPIVSLQLQEMFMYQWRDDIDFREAGWNDMYAFHTVGLTFNLPKLNRAGMKKEVDVAKCPKIKTGTERSDGEGKAKLEHEKKKGIFKKRNGKR
jgi:OmpA-OmpF porin, OOP family